MVISRVTPSEDSSTETLAMHAGSVIMSFLPPKQQCQTMQRTDALMAQELNAEMPTVNARHIVFNEPFM